MIQIKLRRDTSANWTLNNPTLALAEVGVVTDSASDSVKVKIGDGATSWNSLAYFVPGSVGGGTWGSITGTLSDQTDLQTALNLKADDSDLTAHTGNTSNPHSVTKSQVGLSNVDNTSDANKPVSSAQATADASVLSTAQSYADSLVVGLWDDRGAFNASVNAYPSSGGSGTAGAIKKGDIWTVSVAGTLPTAQAVGVGDTVRALQDTPGNTQANWAIAENNIGYVPENSANKDTDVTLAANSDTKYASQKAVKTYIDVIGSSLNSAYVALVDAATIDIPFASKRNPAFTWTSSRTAVTFTVSNDLFSAEAYIQFLKTTASNLVLTFPSGTLITDQNGFPIVGTSVTLTSTTSGDFDIVVKKRSSGYRAIIKTVVI